MDTGLLSVVVLVRQILSDKILGNCFFSYFSLFFGKLSNFLRYFSIIKSDYCTLFLLGLNFNFFFALKNVIWTHTKYFCPTYGPNLPDFGNSFHKVAKKYQKDS
jgi:hypothetical protein